MVKVSKSRNSLRFGKMTLEFKSSDESFNQTEVKDGSSTENWMSSLPDSLQHVPLSQLAIPGTHDSGSFSNCTTLAPDANGCLKCLVKIPFVKKIILSWAKCQDLDFTEQLFAGIRYFDLRVEATPGREDFYLVHTLLGPKVSDLVEAVLAFLETHSHEIVLLDFNHFYCMEVTDHNQLIQYLISKIGSKICNRCDIRELTLHNLWSQGKQVIIFYQNDAARCFNEVWPACRIASPWPNTDDPQTCIDRLTGYFTNPPKKDFIVCQGVLTPDTSTVVKGIFKNGSVKALSATLLPWLSSWVEQSPTQLRYPLTIVIADFVENGDLIQQILDLNSKRTVSL